jgi:hypothetical protein
MARRYAISSLAEAKAYLAHPVLGDRLRECTRAVLDSGENVSTIFPTSKNCRSLKLTNWLIGSLAHWLIGSLAHWLIGSLAHWLIGSLAGGFFTTARIDACLGKLVVECKGAAVPDSRTQAIMNLTRGEE